MFEVNNQSLIHHFKSDSHFRNQLSLHLAQIGKSIYPIFPDQIAFIKRNHFYMICTYIPIVGLLYLSYHQVLESH